MNNLLSIIIPSHNRADLLNNTVSKLVDNFKILNFNDYEIVVINNGTNKNTSTNITENTKVYNFEDRMYPGIARNVGIENSKSEWVWFIDDDDEVLFENITNILDLINTSKFDVIAHSLKLKYKEAESKNELLENILLFKEKQELFNYIFKRDIVESNKLKFSDGLHEDIRYVAELILYSKEVKILDYKVYNKITRDDSITRKLNYDRIDGYINAISEILNINEPTIQNLKNQIILQSLGTILYLINKCDISEKSSFINYLEQKFPDEFRKSITKKYTEKSTNFKYASSLFLNKTNTEKFIDDLDYCFKSYLSCKDLKNSIFFGPGEIIGCCKRFFYKGKMKGDIVLMNNTADITLNSILDRKKEVEDLINTDRYEECEGCPYLQRFEKNNNEKVNYISLENFTYCNMRCTYCAPKYYGGREPAYDTDTIISDLINGEYLGNDVHIVWGGGEPTLKPKFDEITNKLLNSDKVSKIRVLTNSLRFSNALSEMTRNEKIRIVTSIDAGSQTKFKEVRGKGEIRKVLENLKVYNETITAPENLTIKYILTEDNYYSDELEEFVKVIKEFGFENNFIQISCNFKLETPTQEMTYAIYELAGRLLNNGFQFVYFDDLIRDRLNISEELAENIIEFLKSKNLFHKNILSHHNQQNVILWGDGYQSKWIKNKTLFGKSGNIIKVVSSKSELTDDDLKNDTVICPAAIQSLPEIYKEIKKSNLLDKIIFAIFI